jgi:Fe-S-cluster containining protein
MASKEFQLNECFKFVRSNFKCEKCARCCICEYDITITEKEARKISKEKNVPVSNIVDKRLKEGRLYFFLKHQKHEPCMFLVNKECSIYNIRPDSCKTYPHRLIKERSKLILKNMDELIIVIPPKCPALLKIIDKLKTNFNATIYPQKEDAECTEKIDRIIPTA